MIFSSFERRHWLGGFQWFFFIFCNTVVVPPTLVSVFQLPPSSLLLLTQYAFIATGLACLAQAVLGHQRAIMEGPTGLWWSTILTITAGEAARGTPIDTIASSLAAGILLSSLLTVAIGLSGIGYRLARLFTPVVMTFFMLMLGAQLTSIFFKGMLGLPFGASLTPVGIQVGPALLSLTIVCLMLGMIIFLPSRVSRYALLVGSVAGWVSWEFFFSADSSAVADVTGWQWFPLGYGGEFVPGIMLTAVLAGLVNITNTYGALRGTDIFYPEQKNANARYWRSFLVSGTMTLLTIPMAVVPFSPFVSSIGLLTQTREGARQPFILGGLCCLLVGAVTPLTRFFTTLPLTVSCAVMLVSYLPLLYSSLLFSQQVRFTSRTIYRLALPLFVGLFLMNLPGLYLQSLPLVVRPLLSNGLLVGVLLALAMENLIPWERIESHRQLKDEE